MEVPYFSNLINFVLAPLYSLFVASSILYFIFGIGMFIYYLRINPDQSGIAKGKQHMMYGLLGVLIIMSAGSVVKFFEGIFGSII